MMENRFREIDDLVLHLKGLVLVRELLASRGAGAEEIDAHSVEIERVRERLARAVRQTGDAVGIAA
jgi:hypothetical protein